MKSKVKIIRKTEVINGGILHYNAVMGATYTPTTTRKEIIIEEIVSVPHTKDLQFSILKTKQRLDQKTTVSYSMKKREEKNNFQKLSSSNEEVCITKRTVREYKQRKFGIWRVLLEKEREEKKRKKRLPDNRNNKTIVRKKLQECYEDIVSDLKMENLQETFDLSDLKRIQPIDEIYLSRHEISSIC